MTGFDLSHLRQCTIMVGEKSGHGNNIEQEKNMELYITF